MCGVSLELPGYFVTIICVYVDLDFVTYSIFTYSRVSACRCLFCIAVRNVGAYRILYYLIYPVNIKYVDSIRT
jgi:hypothetical protein